MAAKFPKFPPRNSAGEKPGGWDPKARLDEMAVDGVSAEVLYATYGLRLYALEDAPLQEACFEIANDWMMEYCKAAPGRLFGIPMISMYNIPNAIKELERCKKERHDRLHDLAGAAGPSAVHQRLLQSVLGSGVANSTCRSTCIS